MREIDPYVSVVKAVIITYSTNSGGVGGDGWVVRVCRRSRSQAGAAHGVARPFMRANLGTSAERPEEPPRP